MSKEKLLSINYSEQYFNALKYLYKKKLGDYLSSFVNDLYYKSDLFTPNSSPQFKIELLNLLENSLKYSIKDLNYDRQFSKIEHYHTLKNISFLYFNINPNKYEKTLDKIEETLIFYESNKPFFESIKINPPDLYFLLKFKSNLLNKTNNFSDEINVLQNIIEILYQYKDDVDNNYKEKIADHYDSLIFASFKISDFKSLIYLINKFNNEIPEFELSEIKSLLEATTINQKLVIVEKLTSDLENQTPPIFKQKVLFFLIDYLASQYGRINNLNINNSEEKKLIIHYYFIKYLISKNDNWTWKLNPENKIYHEKVHLDSFYLVYNDYHSVDVDINFNKPINILKLKNQIINEIIHTNNPNKSRLINKDFLDKINFEIKELYSNNNDNKDEFILKILNNNISTFQEINSNYNDLIILLGKIYNDVLSLTFGLDYYIRIEKVNKLKTFLKSKLNKEINTKDLIFRIDICNNYEDFNKLKDFISTSHKSNKTSSLDYIKFTNYLNFLEYNLFEEQHLNIESNKNINVSNEYLIPLANKIHNFYISNLEAFNNLNEYNTIIDLINNFDFEPNIKLINKYLTFYNSPGNLLNNQNKFTLDKNLGKLYYKIKNYSKAKMYLSSANANTLIYEDVNYAFLKWDILIDIFYCDILDNTITREEKNRSINYIKGVFEEDINRIKDIKSENISRMLNEIKYKYNTICLHEAKEQNDILKEKNLLIEQINLNKTLHLFNDFDNEFDLIKCKSKLNEISNEEQFKLITELYKKNNKTPDIGYSFMAENINDFETSINIQLSVYTKELIHNLKYINKLSYSNQFTFFNEIWDNRKVILYSYFKLSNEGKQKYLNRLLEYFILSDNVDAYNSNLYSNNNSKKIDELILEKKKLFNITIRNEDYDKISNNIDFLQQQLKLNENNSIWNYQFLKENLKENQAYVRIFFNYSNYYAFIVTNTTLKLIDLNSNSTIDFQKAFAAYMKNLKEQEENPLAYDIFYSKIFNAIPKEINELFFQNEGVYINLNPDGFKSNSTDKYLIESYDIHTINSSYNFTNLDSKINFENALFIGNPKFQSTGLQIPKTSTNQNNTRGTLLPLPSTQKEVQVVSKLLTNENISTKCLLQTEATENNLNILSSNFDLIHIATHGFYKDDNSDLINQYDFGLYLSGALDYINNNKEKNQMIDEGIVYAPEIELLNLSKAKLVVLSACETGFGNQSKIGKISLTSSFIMAGAKNVLSTLWKVDDKVTMEFINEFYKKLLQLKNIKTALRQTQLEFLEKYKSPYYWAPFMLLQNRG